MVLLYSERMLGLLSASAGYWVLGGFYSWFRPLVQLEAAVLQVYSVRQVIRHEVEAGCEQRREEVVKRELRSLHRGTTLGHPYFCINDFL